MESGFAQRPIMMIFYKYYLQSILFRIFMLKYYLLYRSISLDKEDYR